LVGDMINRKYFDELGFGLGFFLSAACFLLSEDLKVFYLSVRLLKARCSQSKCLESKKRL
jgi:hypothetical protein